MIFIKDYDDSLRRLGREFLIFHIHYVSNLAAWAKKNGVALSEPAQPLKLITTGDNSLVMMAQSEITGETLEGLINGLGVRWAVRNVAEDISKRLNSLEKRLAYCFLKEYAETKEDLAGDELLEDDWAISQMEKLGYFRT